MMGLLDNTGHYRELIDANGSLTLSNPLIALL